MNNTKQTDETVTSAVQRAISAAQAGNKLLARLTLEETVKSERDNPDYWIWVAWTAESPTGAASALEQALCLDPDHVLAKQGLAWAAGMQSFDPNDYVPSKLRSEATDADASVEFQSPIDEQPAPDETVVTKPIESGLNQGTQRNQEAHVDASHPVDQSKTDTESLLDPALSQETTEDVNEALISDFDESANDLQGESDAELVQDAAFVDDADESRSDPSDLAAGDTLRDIELLCDSIEETCRSADLESEQEATPVREADSESASASDAEVSDAAEVVAEERVAAKDVPAAAAQDTEASADEANPSERSETRTILVADDSPTIRKIVSMSLERVGYRVITAVDGKEALEQMSQCSPSLVLTDIRMPQIDGYQLCKLIKSHAKTKTIPVIMLSGKDGIFDKMKGKFVGCDDYITKPFQSSELLQKIESYLPVAITDT